MHIDHQALHWQPTHLTLEHQVEMCPTSAATTGHCYHEQGVNELPQLKFVQVVLDVDVPQPFCKL